MEHPHADLIGFDRSPSSGYATFLFYDRMGSMVGKLTFDEAEEDMVWRAGTVLDHLGSTSHSVLYQNEIEQHWNADEPASRPTPR